MTIRTNEYSEDRQEREAGVVQKNCPAKERDCLEGRGQILRHKAAKTMSHFAVVSLGCGLCVWADGTAARCGTRHAR